MTTINDLIRVTKLSRYYVTKAVRAVGIEIKCGRKPLVLSKEQERKIKKILRSIVSVKNLNLA